jgi:hypothetical protein
VDDVVAIMTEIEHTLPQSDGLWWFNHLYLQVTTRVRTAIGQAVTFDDPQFLDRLDVIFGNLYFDAIAGGDANPSLAPPAWRPLLEVRMKAGVEPLQYALAGMNAHINRDLPVGIVTAYEELGGCLTSSNARHDDFERVNAILETVEAQVKTQFLSGAAATLDAIATPVDDTIAMWNIRAARDAAWTNAEVMWSLTPTPMLRQDFFDRLDRFTGFAARGLLAPLAVVRAS